MPLYSRAKAIAIPQKPGIHGVYEKIEAAARTCYRSEGCTKYDENGDSITAEEFASRIIRTYKHESVGEHGTVYLFIEWMNSATQPEIVARYSNNRFSRVVVQNSSIRTYAYITTNYRVIVENHWEGDLQYWSEPTMLHVQRYTVRIFTDRGVSAEANRHRDNSPSERSTRFVNYGHDGAITICAPEEISDREVVLSVNEWGGVDGAFKNMCSVIAEGKDNMFNVVDTWIFANSAVEWSYLRLLKLGWKPQQARRVLPMDVETELVITAFPDQWAKFFGWRFYGFTGTPHPDIKYVTGLIMDEFIHQGWNDALIEAEQKYSKK